MYSMRLCTKYADAVMTPIPMIAPYILKSALMPALEMHPAYQTDV